MHWFNYVRDFASLVISLNITIKSACTEVASSNLRKVVPMCFINIDPEIIFIRRFKNYSTLV